MPNSTEPPWAEKYAEAQKVAAMLFAPVRQVGPTGDGLGERINAADNYTWLADETDEWLWTYMANAVCSVALQTFDAWERAYAAFCKPNGNSPETAALLHELTADVIWGTEVSNELELAWKLVIAARVGLQAMSQREGCYEGPDFDQLRAHINGLPNGDLLLAYQDMVLQPESELPPNAGMRVVLTAVERAGPEFQRSLQDDVRRLSAPA